ncbi:toll/interleukin-1 receptor domain-containing protein [Diaphorobacter caeni]|uniref:toll/interleukin-1 receptor domain-containing protein n=1 Tax=Diaphorobacter caeni TaxID=2784387 RepID=UPI00188FD63D|nr:toll/interleukin-1 receptor domain-containing protein [Diaphorobacter caeni]MBF5005319.1 toll/interleukin-1 receptor domain-containing protein [Diaphorobacter caeni]
MTDQEHPADSGCGAAQASATTAQEKRYRAFISYSHSDNREQGRKWADWLHHSLETYQIPAELIGKTNTHGQPIPAQIFPVFQDEKELSANADLSASLKDALDHSDFLVFLASPRSARSVYVQEELRHFKRLGRGDRVIAMILRGEPAYGGAVDAQSDDQCFPAVLRHAVDGQGRIIEAQAEEALAADVRLPHSSEEGFTSSEAYRQHLHAQKVPPSEIRQRVVEYEGRLNLARLKIISTILGVPLADLTRRDQAYQLERMRRRSRIVMGVAAGMGGLAIAAVIAGALAWQQKTRAQQNFAFTLYTSGLNKIAQNEYGDPAAYIAASVREGNANATAFAESMLATREDLTPLPNLLIGDLLFSPDGRYVAGRARAGAEGSHIQVFDVRTRAQVADIYQPRMVQGIGRPRFDAQNRIYFSDDAYRVLRYDLETRKQEVLYANPAKEEIALLEVSPDGHWLGLRHLRGKGDLLLVPTVAAAGRESRRLAAGQARMAVTRFAADSTLATLCAERDDKTTECLIAPLQTGEDVGDAVTVKLEGSPPPVAFAPGGRKLVFWRGAQLQVWDGGDVRPIATDGRIYDWVGFNPGGQTILALADSEADVYRLPNGERVASQSVPESLQTVLPDRSGATPGLSPDAAHALVSRNKRAFLQQLTPTPQLVSAVPLHADTRRVVADAGGEHLFILRKDSNLVARRTQASGAVEDNFLREDVAITELYAPKGGKLATLSASNQLRFYDASSGKPTGVALRVLSSVQFSADGQRVAARTGASRMGVWQISDGKQIVDWNEADGELPRYALEPSFKYMLQAGDADWSVLDVASRKPVLAGKEALTVPRFSPDGRLMAVADKGGKVTVWQVASGTKLFEFASTVTPLLRFSPDGSTLLASEDARRLRLWDTQTGQAYGQVVPVALGQQWAEFSADGRRIFLQDTMTESLAPWIKVVDSRNGNLISMPFARGTFSEVKLLGDERLLLTIGMGTDGLGAQLWQVPGTLHLPPERLASDLENYYGRKYDMQTGAIRAIDAKQPADSWFFADPYLRKVTPSSGRTVVQDIAARLPLKDGAQLRSLAAISLDHPLARAGIAEYLAHQEGMGALVQQLVQITERQLVNDVDGVDGADGAQGQGRGERAAAADLARQTRSWLDKARALTTPSH